MRLERLYDLQILLKEYYDEYGEDTYYGMLIQKLLEPINAQIKRRLEENKKRRGYQND